MCAAAGQDQAVNAVADAVLRSRAGLASQTRGSSFLFLGPTGVGKTELAKALAELLFDDEKNMVGGSPSPHKKQSHSRPCCEKGPWLGASAQCLQLEALPVLEHPCWTGLIVASLKTKERSRTSAEGACGYS